MKKRISKKIEDDIKLQLLMAVHKHKLSIPDDVKRVVDRNQIMNALTYICHTYPDVAIEIISENEQAYYRIEKPTDEMTRFFEMKWII